MSKPVRLAKKEPNVSPLIDFQKVDDWAMSHAHIILPLCVIILLFLFVCICYMIVGASAVESGVKYNHFQDMI